MNRQFLIQTTNEIISLHSKQWTRSEAVTKGIKISLFIFLCALLSVFIPLIHFISVPVGILSSPLIGYLVYRAYLNQEDIIDGEITCFFCKSIISLKGKAFSPQISVACDHCRKVSMLISQN